MGCGRPGHRGRAEVRLGEMLRRDGVAQQSRSITGGRAAAAACCRASGSAPGLSAAAGQARGCWVTGSRAARRRGEQDGGRACALLPQT